MFEGLAFTIAARRTSDGVSAVTFQPVIPSGGLIGWRFLQRTYDAQLQSYSASGLNERDARYFLDNIGKVKTAEDLVSDRRLLQVALGAFGLESDLDNRYFVQKILSDGTQADDALANRLADKRYRQLSEAFGFGDFGPRTVLPSFATEIINRYEARQFEIAVGEQDADMRVALSLGDSLTDLFDQASGEDAQWFAMMGNPPLRRTFEVALGLPAAFGQVDIDDQLITFKDRAASVLGVESFSDFADPDMQEDLIRMFLVRAQVEAGNSLTNGTIALTLLQSVAPLNPA